MCQFAFQTSVTNRWLVQIAEGPFIFHLASGKEKKGKAVRLREQIQLLQTVNSGTADWFGLQFWLGECLTCKSE